MKKTICVLISGASIVSSVLAYLLHRHGFNVVIVERSTLLLQGSSNTAMNGNAVMYPYAIPVRGRN